MFCGSDTVGIGRADEDVSNVVGIFLLNYGFWFSDLLELCLPECYYFGGISNIVAEFPLGGFLVGLLVGWCG